MAVVSRPLERDQATALERLVLAELPVLYRVARRFAGSRDPEDLVGRALVKAACAWPSFDGGHGRAWLLRILRNEYLMALRVAKARPTESSEEMCDVSDPATIDATVFRRMTDEMLFAELDALPEDERTAIVLCDIEGLKYAEAAVVMETAVGTVASRLHRGRARLRDRLKGRALV